MFAAISAAVVLSAAAGPAERATFRALGLFDPARTLVLTAAFAGMPGVVLEKIDYADAEVTLTFHPRLVAPGAKPAQYVERLDDKLRGATRHTLGLKPRRTLPREKLEKITIPAAGLDCPGCCLAAYEAVAKLDGVEAATASFADGRVTALIDPARTDKAKLEDALRKLGVQLGKR